MPQTDGKTYAISTEWVVEVFDWKDEVPTQTGGNPGVNTAFAGNNFLDQSVGALGVAGDVNKNAYLNKDILTSLSSMSFLGSLGLRLPSGSASLSELQTAFEQNVFAEMDANYVGGLKWLLDNADGVSYGIVSISFSRAKFVANQQCTIVVVGPLPSHTVAGSWVIASIAISDKRASDVMPKFIGQIQMVSTDYAVMSSGAVVLRSTITVSSWSNLLLSPVVFDLRAGKGVVDSQPVVAILGTQSAGGSNPMGLNDILKSAKMVFNPYQSAKFFLSLLGVINASSSLSTDTSTLFRSAASMPEMPRAFLDRIGFYEDSKTAFANGLVKIIAGRQNEVIAPSIPNDWDGTFGSTSGVDWSKFVSSYDDFSSSPDKQASMANVLTVAQISNASIWSIITERCDPTLNEVYTDIFYDVSNGFVQPRLAIVVRGKPFRSSAAEKMCFNSASVPTKPDEKPVTGSILNAQPKINSFPINVSDFTSLPAEMETSEAALGEFAATINTEPLPPIKSCVGVYKTWNKYEKIPRIQLDAALIIGMHISNTFLVSPTLFTLGFDGMPERLQGKNVEYLSFQTQRHDAEMLRFGSNVRKVTTQYMFLQDPSGADTFPWFAAIGYLNRVWDGFTYRTANGTINIKDPGLALSIGFNLQFTITGVNYIVHIESLDTSFSIDANGSKSTTTTIHFSRMMQINELTKEMEFCPMYKWGDLWNNAPNPISAQKS